MLFEFIRIIFFLAIAITIDAKNDIFRIFALNLSHYVRLQILISKLFINNERARN